LFTDGFGFIVDYLAEVLRHLRGQDFLHAYTKQFELSSGLTTRDRDGVNKTFSGLMKVLFPDGECTKQEVEEMLSFAMEGRRRVKEQLLKLDETFSPVEFTYTDIETGVSKEVITLEERQYPTLARGAMMDTTAEDPAAALPADLPPPSEAPPSQPQAGHLVFAENSKNTSYRTLFAKHLRGAREITVVDPYVRAFWQIRNFMEFVQVVHELTPEGDETRIRLITKSDPERAVEQDQHLVKIQDSCVGSRVSVEFEYDSNDNLHARSITTDTGWKISLDRGLDIFQRYEISPFSLSSSVQEERLTKSFEVTYLKV
jgi:ATP-dependent Lon protease